MHHFKNFSGLNYRDFPPVKIVKKKKKIYSHVNLLQQSIARRSLKRYNKQLYKNLKKKHSVAYTLRYSFSQYLN